MTIPTPGSPLDDVATIMADPLFQIVARLAQGPIDAQDQPLDLASLVECNFAGYAPVPIAADLSAAFDTPAIGEMTPVTVEFTTAPGVATQRITHIYFTKSYNGAAPGLLSGVAFADPLIAEVPGQVFAFPARVTGIFSPG